jgi:hypothetical protein
MNIVSKEKHETRTHNQKAQDERESDLVRRSQGSSDPAHRIGQVLGLIAHASDLSLGHHRWLTSETWMTPQTVLGRALVMAQQLGVLERNPEVHAQVGELLATIDAPPETTLFDARGVGRVSLGYQQQLFAARTAR